MNFETYGPYFCGDTMITKEHAKDLRHRLEGGEYGTILSSAPGCYVFGVKSSGSSRVIPWYVGKAERQPAVKEALNDSHLQVYNEIFHRFKRGSAALFFLPAITNQGRPTKLAPSGGNKPAIDFLEDWLIAVCLKTNPDLWNIKKTAILRDMYVRGVFNPRQGDLNSHAAEFKATLGL